MWLGDKLNNNNGVEATHKEGNENCGIHKNQGKDGSQAVAETVGDGSGQENTDESTTLTGLEESTLLSGWDGMTGSLNHTVLLLKSGKRDKVTVQKHVERLHDLMGISGRSAQKGGRISQFEIRGTGGEPRMKGSTSRLTMVKHMMKAHKQAQGWLLTAAHMPSSCSRFSPSTASFMRSGLTKTSE